VTDRAPQGPDSHAARTTGTARSPEEMEALGAAAAARAKPGDVFALTGPLGAGKTCWTRGFTNAAGSTCAASSPTFGIVHEYRGNDWPIFHLDLYRIGSADELVALGWDELLDAGAVLVCEWADRFPALFPGRTQWLAFRHEGPELRSVSLLPRPS
jgi:tRNA threonylcarbamoyladenosine biosynthesis protein TsaE